MVIGGGEMPPKATKAFRSGRAVAKKFRSEQKKSRSIRTFNLDDESYENFKRCCQNQGLKMSNVIDELMQGFVSHSGQESD
jgi:hypothetical protein